MVKFLLTILLMSHVCVAANDKKPAPLIPIDVPVVMVEVVNDFVPHGEEPYVEHKMSPSPITGLQTWLEKILRPVGKHGSAVVRIQEVSVRWQKRPGKLEKQGYWPYRSIIRLKIEIFDKRGKLVGALNPEATRVREVNENFFGGNKHEMWQSMYLESLQSIEWELRRALPKILSMSAKSDPAIKAVAKDSLHKQEKRQETLKDQEPSAKIKTPRKKKRKGKGKGKGKEKDKHHAATAEAVKSEEKTKSPSKCKKKDKKKCKAEDKGKKRKQHNKQAHDGSGAKQHATRKKPKDRPLPAHKHKAHKNSR